MAKKLSWFSRLRGQRIEGACVVDRNGRFLRFSPDFIAECDEAAKNYDSNVKQLFGDVKTPKAGVEWIPKP